MTGKMFMTFAVCKGIVLLILINSADSMGAGSLWVQLNIQKMVTDFLSAVSLSLIAIILLFL